MIRSSPLVIHLNQIGGIKVSPDKHKEQEEKSTQGTEQEGTQDTESVQPNKEVTEKGEEIKDDLDRLLDEIDEILEEEYEEFIESYVQRGGE